MARGRPRGRRAANGEASNEQSEVWMGYPMSKNCAPSLYSFAWAQAVQNKPLALDLTPMTDGDLASKNDSGDRPGRDEACNVIIGDSSQEGDSEVEKEEGELEEGEIELGTEPMVADEMTELSSDKSENKLENTKLNGEESQHMGDFDGRVSLILEDLETITSEEAKASFEGVCLRLRKSFEDLKQKFTGMEGSDIMLHALVQRALTGIQIVYSVLNSVSLQKKEQNMLMLSRLLIHIKNQYSLILTSEQIKEIDILVNLLVFGDKNKEKEQHGGIWNNNNLTNLSKEAGLSSGNLLSLGNPYLAPKAANLPNFLLPTPVKSGVEFSPLLDLHADYDDGSLPSPTRENTPHFPIPKPIGLGMVPAVSSHPVIAKNEEVEDATLQPYVIDAFKAFSSFQQKHVKGSFLPINRLPSPTPSEEGNKDDDSHEEISTSSVSSNATSGHTATESQVVKSSSSVTHTNSTTGDQLCPVKLVEEVSSGIKPVVKPALKIRDPRLRFMNNEARGLSEANRGIGSNTLDNEFVRGIVNVRKHKIIDDSVAKDHTRKRQRSGSMSPKDNQMTSSIGGWLEENSITSQPNERNQLLQMEQQRLAAENQQGVTASKRNVANGSSVNGLPGAVSSVNSTSFCSKEAGMNQPGISQIPPQSATMSSQNDIGRKHMKSRDPRRILHSNMVQNNGAIIPEQKRINVATSGHQTTMECLTKNLANIVPGLQLITSSPAVPHSKSQSILDKDNQVDVKPALAELNNPKTLSAVAFRGGAEGALESTNPWGDVDHLLDEYNDEQKVAIHRERARRIAEQNKMFASGKLCLVLDLDHTLLNSAKFVEVDPVYDEILRRKEEHDREKPQRHVFRFQHMGMWTKLRPGIWNFLEKASNLFELHLYTMGNKLYATEMAKVLDPTGSLFCGRIISRGDDGDPLDGGERVPKTKDLDGVLGMESAVVIIDDSRRVWPHNKLNLIVVERYTYFPSSRRQFGLLGPSLLEIDHDERPDDGTLASSLAVIERIHQNFFSHNSIKDADVRNILAAEQRWILAGCRIVFSRIFPVGEANPHLHPLWQTAEQFGAVCTNQIDEQVTHVVANSLGTDKVNWALSTGRFVVHPGWVEASSLLYRRANEQDFAVKTWT